MSDKTKETAKGGAAEHKNTTDVKNSSQAKGTPAPAEATTEKAKEEQPPTPKPKTTPDILRKTKQLTEVIDKLDSLNVAAKELDSINFGTRNGADTLEITDGRNSFTTSNPNLLADCVTYLKERVEKRSQELEQELLTIHNS